MLGQRSVRRILVLALTFALSCQATFPDWYSFLGAGSDGSNITIYNVTLGKNGSGPYPQVQIPNRGDLLATFVLSGGNCFGALYTTDPSATTGQLGRVGCGDQKPLQWPYSDNTLPLPASSSKLLGSVTATFNSKMNGIMVGFDGYLLSFVNLTAGGLQISTIVEFHRATRALGAYSPQSNWYYESAVSPGRPGHKLVVDLQIQDVLSPIPGYSAHYTAPSQFDLLHTVVSETDDVLGVVRKGDAYSINLVCHKSRFSLDRPVIQLGYPASKGTVFSAYYDPISTYYHVLFQESKAGEPFKGHFIVAELKSKSILSSTAFNAPMRSYITAFDS